MTVAQRPPRVLGGPHGAFWDYCTAGEFRLQQCVECQSWLWPPAPVCDSCLSEQLSWKLLSGRAELVTSCLFEREYYPQCPPPWPVVLVRLDEGPLFVSNPYEIDYELLRPGLRLRAQLLRCADAAGEFGLPVFALDPR